MPRIDADSITSAEATVERVRTALLAGASFDSLARLYHDAAEQRELGETALDKLAEPYKGLLATAQTGAVAPVTPIEVGPRTKYLVLQVVSRREEGDTVFEDVKDQVRSTLAKQLGVRRYLDRLKGASYVEIRGT
jgi:parvulin-like peptidyl-prolyl isomerase